MQNIHLRWEGIRIGEKAFVSVIRYSSMEGGEALYQHTLWTEHNTKKKPKKQNPMEMNQHDGTHDFYFLTRDHQGAMAFDFGVN